jgi:molybdopterin converting factor small subunit
MDGAALVTVEFFGIPRQRAGRAELEVRADTVTDALAAVERACPRLGGLRQADGRISPHFLVSVNGDGFVTDPGRPVQAGDHVLLLSADAGG